MLLNELEQCQTMTHANRIVLDICKKIKYQGNSSKRRCRRHTNAIIKCARRFYDSNLGISTLLYGIFQIGYGNFSNIIPLAIDVLTSTTKGYMEKLEAFGCICYMDFDDVDKDIFNISFNRLAEYAKVLINSDNPDDNVEEVYSIVSEKDGSILSDETLVIDDTFPSISEMVVTALEVFNSNRENFDESSN